jgi:1-acyl-sn-glycerol-3-phosphate acyltransferase
MVAWRTLVPSHWPSPRVLLVSVLSWGWMLATLSLAFSCQCIAYPFLALFASDAQRCYWLGFIFRAVSQLFIAGHPLWKLRVVRGRQPLSWAEWAAERFAGSERRLPGRLVIMCNHVSDLDPFATNNALVPLECKYIAKGSLFSIPVGGWALRLAGDVPVHFTAEKGGWGVKKGSTARMFEHCRRIVDDCGIPIVVFPEGTRDGSLQLKEFKRGMFDFAVQQRCHLLPMAIDGPQRCWPFPGPFFDSGSIKVTQRLRAAACRSCRPLAADVRLCCAVSGGFRRADSSGL